MNTFDCFITHSIIYQISLLLFSLYIPTAPPDPVSNINHDVSDTSVTITWTTSFDGFSPITHIEIEVFQDDELIQGPLRFSPSQPSARITGLEPSSNYTLMIYAVNAVGRSLPVRVTIMTLHFGKFYQLHPRDD